MVRIPLFLSSLVSGSVRPLIYGKTAKLRNRDMSLKGLQNKRSPFGRTCVDV